MKIAPIANSKPNFQKGLKGANNGKRAILSAQNLIRATVTTALLSVPAQITSQEIYTDAYGNQFVSYSDYLDLRRESIQAGEELGESVAMVMLKEQEIAESQKKKSFWLGTAVGAIASGLAVSMLKKKD